jgi:hypothetical protein
MPSGNKAREIRSRSSGSRWYRNLLLLVGTGARRAVQERRAIRRTARRITSLSSAICLFAAAVRSHDEHSPVTTRLNQIPLQLL